MPAGPLSQRVRTRHLRPRPEPGATPPLPPPPPPKRTNGRTLACRLVRPQPAGAGVPDETKDLVEATR